MPMFSKGPIFQQLSDRPMAHCATLTELPDGSLLAAWFGGSFETAPDVVILASEYDPVRGDWSPPRLIAEVPGHSLGQPVFLVRPDGELWLFFVVIMGGGEAPSPPASSSRNLMPPLADWTSAQPHWQRSLDGGRTWESPEQLMDYAGLMFRSRPLILPDRIILPVYDENTWESRMLISDDDGRSWRLTEPIVTSPGNIHPCLAPLSDGRLLAYLRTGGEGGFIWRTESADGGETWATPRPTSLVNPNSGLDLLRLQSGRLVLAFNNSDRYRTPLCVALAEEDEVWQWWRTLEDEHAEFSYPTLLQTEDGTIHIVYTYKREHIHHAYFTAEWLRKGEVHDESED
ncbi:MAG: Sialidase [Anaerolineales bacterium]|nr:Sialidase [Anaerolineales bacterium]